MVFFCSILLSVHSFCHQSLLPAQIDSGYVFFLCIFFTHTNVELISILRLWTNAWMQIPEQNVVPLRLQPATKTHIGILPIRSNRSHNFCFAVAPFCFNNIFLFKTIVAYFTINFNLFIYATLHVNIHSCYLRDFSFDNANRSVSRKFLLTMHSLFSVHLGWWTEYT